LRGEGVGEAWRVVRFTNDEVFTDIGAVQRRIVEAVGD
jgi:very-short-patch-repair endonuclease